MNSETNVSNKLIITDKIPLFSAIIAALPFHILLFFGVLKVGITWLTFLYLNLNIVISYCMYKYLKHVYRDKKTALKKLFYFEFIPALIISVLLASWGKSDRPLSPKFQKRMEQYFSGKHGQE